MQMQAVRKRSKSTSMTMLAIFVFLTNIIVKYFVPDLLTKVLPVISVVILMLVTNNKALRINRGLIGYLIFGLLYLLGAVYSVSPMKGFLYALSYILAVLFVSFAVRNSIEWNKVLTFITITCSILTAGTLLQSINPSLLSSITKHFRFTAQERYYVEAWAKNKWFCGFFPDRAPAAFFSSMLCGAGLYYLLKNRKEEKNIVRLFGAWFYVLGVWGILLTAKRGLLFGMLIATLICYLANRRASGKPILYIIVAVVIISFFGYIIVSNLPIAEVMLNRIFRSDDFYTNRLDIYNDILKNVKSHFLVGTGTASADALLGVGGHNIYLTVLMENGIVGAVLFVIVWISEIIKTIRNIMGVSAKHFENGLPVLTFSLFIQLFFVTYGMSGNPLYDNYILNFYFIGVLMNESIGYEKHKQKIGNNYISGSV